MPPPPPTKAARPGCGCRASSPNERCQIPREHRHQLHSSEEFPTFCESLKIGEGAAGSERRPGGRGGMGERHGRLFGTLTALPLAFCRSQAGGEQRQQTGSGERRGQAPAAPGPPCQPLRLPQGGGEGAGNKSPKRCPDTQNPEPRRQGAPENQLGPSCRHSQGGGRHRPHHAEPLAAWQSCPFSLPSTPQSHATRAGEPGGRGSCLAGGSRG